MNYRPLDIKKLVDLIALDPGYKGTANYLSAQDIIDLFNEMGYGDCYGNTGIEAEGMDANPSRKQYARQRVEELKNKGQIPSLISLLLGTVGDAEGLYKNMRDHAPALLNGVDVSAYENSFEAQTTVFDRLPKGKNPIVFISYSWDSDEHKAWVLKLAEDLLANGVFALIDQKYEDGGDLLEFMRRGIKEADRVLVIGTPAYKERASKPRTGVKFEDQTISIDLYYEFSTTKYIPCLRFGSFEESFTEYLGVRKGFDFSRDENYEKELNRLIESIIHPKSDYPELTPIAAPKVAARKLPVEDLKPARVSESQAYQTQTQYGVAGMTAPQTQQQTQTVNIVMGQPAQSVDSSKISLVEMFERLYVPIFDRIFDLLDMEHFHLWTRMLANDGETEILEKHYDDLNALVKFCNTRVKNAQFTEYDDLIENLGLLVSDLLAEFNNHAHLMPDGRYRLEHFYNRKEGDNELLQKFYNTIFLISDYCLELTRLLNLILFMIRKKKFDYKVQEGLLSVESVNNGKPLLYREHEVSPHPYPGRDVFVDARLTREHTLGRVPDIKSRV